MIIRGAKNRHKYKHSLNHQTWERGTKTSIPSTLIFSPGIFHPQTFQHILFTHGLLAHRLFNQILLTDRLFTHNLISHRLFTHRLAQSSPTDLPNFHPQIFTHLSFYLLTLEVAKRTVQSFPWGLQAGRMPGSDWHAPNPCIGNRVDEGGAWNFKDKKRLHWTFQSIIDTWIENRPLSNKKTKLYEPLFSFGAWVETSRLIRAHSSHQLET